jgi:hypothetical protein
MPRERAKLSDKQERILVQCQLMGLTPKDMQQISNRLIAMQKESEWRKEIAEVSAGATWEKTTNGWKITDSQGKIYECTKVIRSRSNRSWYSDSYYGWNINMSKPGTRYKNKSLTDVSIYIDPYITARICPENSKDLFGLLNSIHKGRIS